MTSFNASASTSAIKSAQAVDEPQASSSKSPTSTLISAPVYDLVSRSSGSPSANRKGKGKEKAVEFAPEPNLIGLKGASEADEDERESLLESQTESEEEDEDEENYETERQRRILENQFLLSQLGIERSTSQNNLGESSTINIENGKSPPPAKGRPTGSSRKKDIPILDRSGYIISLPPEGQTHTMACIEIPSDRKLKKRITDGEYTDCSHWTEGEARRWKYGFRKRKPTTAQPEASAAEGQQQEESDNEEEIGGVTKEFRWRRWRGLEKELRKEMRKRGELVEMDVRPVEQSIPEGVSAYSLIQGEACHQCRRKSDKPKMKCRNVNPICRATFCETCCKRYNYFDFDEESRSFICPLCKDICNCSNCIRKKNLAHLLGDSRGKIKRQSIKNKMGAEGTGEMTVQAWIEKAVKDVSRAPFDLIRIVDYDKDIISPDIPDPVVEEDVGEKIIVTKPKKMRAKKRKLAEMADESVTVESNAKESQVEKPKAKRGRKKKVIEEEQIKVQPETQPLVEKKNGKLFINLKMLKAVQPPAVAPTPTERVKEVDSDGDTVGDWSDGNAEKVDSGSSLTSLNSSPSNSPTISATLPFLPHPIYAPIMDTNQYLSTLPGAVQSAEIAQSSPITTNNPELVSHSLPIEDTTLPSSPIQHLDNDNHSSAESGDEQSHPKKRRRPPPEANIVRAPRHSSFSNTHSTPPGHQDDLNYVSPTILSFEHNGPRNLTGDQNLQSSVAPHFTISGEQTDSLNTVPPPLTSFSHTIPISGTSPNRPMHFWQNRSMISGNDRYQGHQTLYPSSNEVNYQNQNQNQQHQYQSGTSPSSYPSVLLPTNYPSYNYHPSPYSSLSIIPYNTSNTNYPINPHSIHHNENTHHEDDIGGPPPYSHSPIRKPNLVLSPNTEGQYLVIDRSPQAQSLDPNITSHTSESTSASRQQTKIKSPNQDQTLNHLDILSLAAAEARHSPSRNEER
ncbi:uncharacterized protein L201_000630 [Kwoniella dendrophila CBS 6074]|uniref:RING-type domain-containing protein n=1 Tax=Kwoniella dendrophila CBS 6074 TaxID=1295534 RepID=A0AAX4JLW4_9TREE